jgi:hypothetical protein
MLAISTVVGRLSFINFGASFPDSPLNILSL